MRYCSTVGMLLVATLYAAQPAAALTMQECSAKYRAAKAAGTLGATTWQQFRKAQCDAVGSAALNPGVMFPSKISPKYANEPAGKARMHTCLDQYKANRATKGNVGLRWIAKGGGYYSECNKRLKG
jgi:hypothetical protein